MENGNLKQESNNDALSLSAVLEEKFYDIIIDNSMGSWIKSDGTVVVDELDVRQAVRDILDFLSTYDYCRQVATNTKQSID